MENIVEFKREFVKVNSNPNTRKVIQFYKEFSDRMIGVIEDRSLCLTVKKPTEGYKLDFLLWFDNVPLINCFGNFFSRHDFKRAEVLANEIFGEKFPTVVAIVENVENKPRLCLRIMIAE